MTEQHHSNTTPEDEELADIEFNPSKFDIRCGCNGGKCKIDFLRLHQIACSEFDSIPGRDLFSNLSFDIEGSQGIVRIYEGRIPPPDCDTAGTVTISPAKVNGIYRVRFTELIDLVGKHSPDFAKQTFLRACPGHISVEYVSD